MNGDSWSKTMKIKRIFTVLLTGIMLTGCAMGKDYSNLKQGDKMDQVVYEFQKLMDQDESGNKKAVFWNGEKAYIDYDELDDKNIEDGRYLRGYDPFSNEKVDINIYGMEDRNEVVSAPDHLLFEAADESWYFELEFTDSFDQKVEELKQDKWLHFMGESKLEYDERRALFRGISTYKGRNYAGYTEVYDDGFDNYCVVKYMAIGNMNDAGVMINQLIDQLRIQFDKDEWIRKKTQGGN